MKRIIIATALFVATSCEATSEETIAVDGIWDCSDDSIGNRSVQVFNRDKTGVTYSLSFGKNSEGSYEILDTTRFSYLLENNNLTITTEPTKLIRFLKNGAHVRKPTFDSMALELAKSTFTLDMIVKSRSNTELALEIPESRSLVCTSIEEIPIELRNDLP